MELHEQLRAHARHSPVHAAATEMLIRGYDGKFAALGQPWIRPGLLKTPAAVNFPALVTYAASLPADERNFLTLVASVADAEQVSLGSLVPGLGHREIEVLLSAICHLSTP